MSLSHKSANDTAEFWLSGVIDTAKFSGGVNDTAKNDSAVSMKAVSHGVTSCTKFHFHWFSGVNDTTQFWLNGTIDIAESWLSGVIADLKLEYLGKFATVFKHILGCESVS
jgi:hypothetical protein